MFGKHFERKNEDKPKEDSLYDKAFDYLWDNGPQLLKKGIGIIGKAFLAILATFDHDESRPITVQNNVSTGPAPETFHEIVGQAGEVMLFSYLLNMTPDDTLTAVSSTLYNPCGGLNNDRAGYDILFNNSDNIHTRIEVKSTHGNPENAFNFTSNELKALREAENDPNLNYRIYRLYYVDPRGADLDNYTTLHFDVYNEQQIERLMDYRDPILDDDTGYKLDLTRVPVGVQEEYHFPFDHKD
ncbi:MAG TPA: DUF3883 domain-containing protein [Candidatus Companilactobacillus pullicola]|uniref:DUF3883 domain-containing protein n=1 Tax=Candidatus Companilactobacillus pullicola TaxID=2838523 RepID=A0A9D2CM30_9LACO|nr:DUF3883 domain-containing protein [Candidatus Companilactobacillus pullicola]